MQTLTQPRTISCYDEDWVLWLDAQVRLLSEKRFAELDVANLVEELDGMKKQYAHELDSATPRGVGNRTGYRNLPGTAALFSQPAARSAFMP